MTDRAIVKIVARLSAWEAVILDPGTGFEHHGHGMHPATALRHAAEAWERHSLVVEPHPESWTSEKPTGRDRGD